MPIPRALALALTGVVLQAALLAMPVLADEGFATWYGQPYHGRRMANGQVYDMQDPTTTANNEYPFGTWLHVTNLANGKSVDVQVRDRGGFGPGLDLSYAAFAKIADPGVSRIRVRYDVIPGPGQPAAPRTDPQPTPPTPPARPAEPTQAPQPAPAAPVEPQPNPGRYTVATGDTLASIARRFGVKPRDMVAWNELANPNLLKPGQVLRLSAPPPPAAPAESQTVAANTQPSDQPSVNVYVVKPGDVLWDIAQRLQVDADALAAANNLGPDAVLLPDQQLVIPTSQVFHVVESGETLAVIADHFETTVGALLDLNDLPDPDTILPGARMRVR